MTRNSPRRPRLCRKATHYFPFLESDSVFTIVSHDTGIQCCSELVVGADEKVFCVPRLTVSNGGVSLSSARFVFHPIVRVSETMILSRGSATATKERLQGHPKDEEKQTTIKGKERRSVKCYAILTGTGVPLLVPFHSTTWGDNCLCAFHVIQSAKAS